MADLRRGETRQLKKDQSIRRETLEELGSEITQDRMEPTDRNPNRDLASGDLDRTERQRPTQTNDQRPTTNDELV